MRVALRRGGKADAGAVEALLTRFWGHADIHAFGQRHAPAAMRHFLAERDGALVGSVSLAQGPQTVRIVALQVLPEAQGRGIGTALASRAEREAIERGLARAEVATTNDNLRALGFWQRRGFRLARIEPAAVERALAGAAPAAGEGIPVRDEIQLVKFVETQTWTGLADAEDRPGIESVVSSAGLPLPAAGDPPVDFVVAAQREGIAACAGWETWGAHALLRSVATRPDTRGRRVGHQTVDRALAEIAARGVREVTLVTLQAAGFFEGLGFRKVERSEVAGPVQASPEFTAHCCGEGTWMRLVLPRPRAPRPPVPPGPVITLVYRTTPEKRASLFAFLRDAFQFYERHGGTRMALYESIDDPGLLLEMVAYATEEDYEADQARVEQDPEMRAKLDEWKTHLSGPVEVRRMRPLSP